jgi:hypothetical protein
MRWSWTLRADALAVVAAWSALVACGAAQGDAARPAQEGRNVTAPNTAASSLKAKIELALQDAARRTQREPAQLRVTLAEAVTWPDGSLGCPQPGRQYTQVLVDGYRILIVAGTATLEYHASVRGQPFLCPEGQIEAPSSLDPRR